ncbi:uncharacterized protein [Halyomorpha halys]|uniref:uncharacterized protein n=1 Tax=Halyomorpha halys TaxID=286706 RepID=UPI0006D522C1|nr:low-density lipoprotein receptor-related protein-like [Halyomorpha halys]
MLIRYCIFTIILTKWGVYGTTWQVLENFKQTVMKYSRTGEEVSKVIEDFLSKEKHNTMDFLYKIDNTPYLERSEVRPFCTSVHQQLDDLLYSFKTDIMKLETPLISLRLEIKDRLSDILSAIDIYQRLGDNRHLNCRPGDYYCVDQIVHWLKEKVEKIQCRVTTCTLEAKNCATEPKNHTRCRRSTEDEYEQVTEEGSQGDLKENKTQANCSEFQCKNGDCIPYESVCNGEQNCADKSDETANCTRYCFNGFHCRDLRCIKKEQVCDGIKNCEDGSDEEKCKELNSAATCNVENSNFLCANKECVPLATVCNGWDDCGDGSDEGPMCGNKTECAFGCTASGGVCFSGPRGALCLNECPDGTVDENGTCRPGPQRALASLEGLFEQVPYLFERYVGALAFLKKRLLSNLEKAVFSCRRPSTELRKSFRNVVQISQ